MHFRFAPDLANWRRESKGVYVRNDGLAKVEHKGNRWVPYFRLAVTVDWQESEHVYGALHAAQDACRRLQTCICTATGRTAVQIFPNG